MSTLVYYFHPRRSSHTEQLGTGDFVLLVQVPLSFTQREREREMLNKNHSLGEENGTKSTLRYMHQKGSTLTSYQLLIKILYDTFNLWFKY